MRYNPIAWFLIGCVRVYQRTFSRLIGPCCRFQPTCSEYFIEAIRKRGVIIGTGFGVWRILRCNPFCKAGYDPVPEKGRHSDAESGRNTP